MGSSHPTTTPPGRFGRPRCNSVGHELSPLSEQAGQGGCGVSTCRRVCVCYGSTGTADAVCVTRKPPPPSSCVCVNGLQGRGTRTCVLRVDGTWHADGHASGTRNIHGRHGGATRGRVHTQIRRPAQLELP
eukprot:3210159-Prymnesium_polylepis.1